MPATYRPQTRTEHRGQRPQTLYTRGPKGHSSAAADRREAELRRAAERGYDVAELVAVGLGVVLADDQERRIREVLASIRK